MHISGNRGAVWLRNAGIAIVAMALAAFAFACADDDESADVEARVRSAVQAYTDADADAFLAHFTDRGLAALFEVPEEEVEAFKEELRQFIGEEPPVIREFQDTEVDGDSASTMLVADEFGIIHKQRVELIRQDDAWLIDGFESFAESPDIPDGYETIDMELQEFAFVFDAEAVPAGKVAFSVENTGEQPHEAVLVSVAEGVDLEEALGMAGEEPPEGIELAGRIQLDPGESYDMVLLDELTAGRYAFVCFFPDTEDPEETPHALKGMVSEFTIE